ncbi:MAG: hypothetical protein DRJ42_05580 [Deltaproteobacteria bacterium]|nr:MAG: hypothetical protein DRJ42_05580 [Deltaproteobacteria bacterium]
MRCLVLISCIFSMLTLPVVALAQPPAGEDAEADAEASGEDDASSGDDDAEGAEDAAEEDAEEDDSVQLRAPTVEPLDIQLPPEEDDAEGDDDELPDPGDALSRLEEGGPPSSDPTQGTWGAPQPAITLHGYFRVRPELWDSFWLGRGEGDGTSDSTYEADPPFSNFRPPTREATVPGGCTGDGDIDSTSSCGESGTLAFANMRLRLEPTISLSDDVKVHMQIDLLDNIVMGSTPDGLITPATSGDPIYERQARTPRVPLDSFSTTQTSPTAGRNALQDAVRVRRAWGEISNRGLGQLRFGRMGSHWGLGILANGGEGIDSDWQSDVDRIMAITKLAGIHLIAAWDFAGEGIVEQHPFDLSQIPFDTNQDDDINQFVFAAARRSTEEEQRETLQRGDAVINGGAYFVYRNHNITSAGVADPYTRPSGAQAIFVRRSAEAFIPDLWFQFKYGDFRLEVEGAMIIGSVQNTQNDSYVAENFNLMSGAVALEAEYRMLDDKLGIHYMGGYSSGDPDVDGLAVTAGLPPQQDAAGVVDNNITTFRMHPNYRIDLILFRNVLTQIAGAYWFKPGLSYDFIRNSFGQLLGARADFIYTRASQPRQAWGNDGNLGAEINASVYYRSEDGPEIYDGFYGMLQYGILFPLAGLGYKEGDRLHSDDSLTNAQIVRVVMGIQY